MNETIRGLIATREVLDAEGFTSHANMVSMAIEETEALVKALEFYADLRRYNGANQRPIPDDPFAKPDAVYIQDVTRDNGAVAIAALAAYRSSQK